MLIYAYFADLRQHYKVHTYVISMEFLAVNRRRPSRETPLGPKAKKDGCFHRLGFLKVSRELKNVFRYFERGLLTAILIFTSKVSCFHFATACPFRFFGLNCSRECHCQNGGACDPRDGLCTCPPGWMGTFCQQRKCIFILNTTVCMCWKQDNNYPVSCYPVSVTILIISIVTIVKYLSGNQASRSVCSK